MNTPPAKYNDTVLDSFFAVSYKNGNIHHYEHLDLFNVGPLPTIIHATNSSKFVTAWIKHDANANRFFRTHGLT